MTDHYEKRTRSIESAVFDSCSLPFRHAVGVGSDYKYDPDTLCNKHHSVMEDLD